MLNQLSPELLSAIANLQRHSEQIARQFQPTMLAMEKIAKSWEPIIESWRPHLEKMHQLTQSPNFKRLGSVHRCQTLMHPIYFELFEPEFSEEEIKQKWRKIRHKLWGRFPKNLDKDSRGDRYNQILKCQTIGAYTPVCRAIYAELEALLRDELLFGNPEWKTTWEDKASADSKRGFQSQQFAALVKNQHADIKLVDENLSLSEVGVGTVAFLLHLEEAFKSFDPAKIGHEETKSFRHIHNHGWAKEASFMDGLNGLLAFDMALELVAKIIEEKNEGTDQYDCK